MTTGDPPFCSIHGYAACSCPPRPFEIPPDTDPDPYAALASVLDRALEQAASGKGKERHAVEGERFEDQQIVQIGRWLGSNHFQIGQAVKKAIEATRLPPDRAVRELLGGIVYLAGAVVLIEEGR